MSALEIKKQNRLETLDHLRGFFIVVIVIDHLSRWPSLFALMSGKALLWVTAAEGFVAISGLLVGYVRGFKNRSLPMAEVTSKLIIRALLLYVWSVIATIIFAACIWYVPLMGGSPWVPIEKGNWLDLIYKVLTLKYTFVWVHFLTLYAVFLAASPIAVYLLRKGLAWLVALFSLGILVIGWMNHNEVLQWQALFFIPSIAGYYLESMLDWWKKIASKRRHQLTSFFLLTTGLTIATSVITTFYPSLLGDISQALNTLFEKETMSLWRLGMAFLWFTGFIMLFSIFKRRISRVFGWLLLPLGTRSLTAYILHGFVVIGVSYFTIAGDNIVINTLLGCAALLITWGLLKIPSINKIIPS